MVHYIECMVAVSKFSQVCVSEVICLSLRALEFSMSFWFVIAGTHCDQSKEMFHRKLIGVLQRPSYVAIKRFLTKSEFCQISVHL